MLGSCSNAVEYKNYTVNMLLGYPQESKIDMSKLQLTADQLAEMVGLIEDGTISGKIAKQILPDLLQVGLLWYRQLLRMSCRMSGICHLCC